MTECNKPVVRRCGGYVVTMAPEGLYIRRPRQRKTFGPLAYSHLELTLAKMEAGLLRDEKRAARERATGKPARRRVKRGYQIGG